MVPVVDVESFLAGRPGALEATAGEIRSALTDIGFLCIVGHGVPWEQVEGIYEQAARYHRLPEATKLAHTMGPDRMGYIPLGGAQKDGAPPALNAAFFMGRPGSRRNHFPSEDDLPGFHDAVCAYYRAMDDLGRRLLPLYATAAGMPPDHFGPFFDPALATLRLTHYPDRPAASDQWGIDPHTDAGFITMLPTNPVAGLAIRLDGRDWFDVAQEPESFVVNSGDMLRRWSNDTLRSTTHRAVNASGGERYAIPFFYDPRVDTVIECLPSCTDDENPPRYEPITYRDYLTEFMRRGYAAVRG
jgi:isopenicillin N synthase-like dioxygenase